MSRLKWFTSVRTLFVGALVMCLLGCQSEPPCSFEGEGLHGPSAGCLVVDQGQILLVEIPGGTYGPPGGLTNTGESAQCAAERETYEETGVIAKAGELAVEFDNGFHLFWCAGCRAFFCDNAWYSHWCSVHSSSTMLFPCFPPFFLVFLHGLT